MCNMGGLMRVYAWSRVMDQVFVVRQGCKKYLANGEVVFWVFMDLERAFMIDQHNTWQVLREHV